MKTQILPSIRRCLPSIFLLFVAAACIAPTRAFGRDYNIVATDGAFDPAVLTAQPGERVNIALQNQGRQYHSIVFVLPQGYIGIRGMIATWRTGTLSFRAPKIPGQYIFYCPIYNHGALGMNGLLIVGEGL
jgi:plastocyanin